jgi:hypothetical protein
MTPGGEMARAWDDDLAESTIGVPRFRPSPSWARARFQTPTVSLFHPRPHPRADSSTRLQGHSSTYGMLGRRPFGCVVFTEDAAATEVEHRHRLGRRAHLARIPSPAALAAPPRGRSARPPGSARRR